MVKSQTGKRNENRGESFITFKERKFGEGDNHPKKFRIVYIQLEDFNDIYIQTNDKNLIKEFSDIDRSRV